MQANAKNNVNSATLTAQIFYVDGNSLRQLASVTASSSTYMNNVAALSKQITFTIPQDAPRTSLSALVTESVQRTYGSYYSYYYPAYYYAAYYNYSNPSCYYYPDYYDYYGYCSYSYTYYPYAYSYYPYSYDYYAYPSYSYTTSTDSGIAPLSYIRAQTPEYSALQTQYHIAEQQLNQSQAQNQQLQQQLQNSQNAIAQRDTTIASLTQQLSTNQNTNTTFEIAAVGLAILAGVFGAFAVHYGRKTKQQRAVSQAPHSKND
jgi:hypothetical protein